MKFYVKVFAELCIFANHCICVDMTLHNTNKKNKFVDNDIFVDQGTHLHIHLLWIRYERVHHHLYLFNQLNYLYAHPYLEWTGLNPEVGGV